MHPDALYSAKKEDQKKENMGLRVEPEAGRFLRFLCFDRSPTRLLVLSWVCYWIGLTRPCPRCPSTRSRSPCSLFLSPLSYHFSYFFILLFLLPYLLFLAGSFP